MRRPLAKLRSLRASRLGSVPLQCAIVELRTAIATMMIVETASNKVAEKFNAATSALNKVQF